MYQYSNIALALDLYVVNYLSDVFLVCVHKLQMYYILLVLLSIIKSWRSCSTGYTSVDMKGLGKLIDFLDKSE